MYECKLEFDNYASTLEHFQIDVMYEFLNFFETTSSSWTCPTCLPRPKLLSVTWFISDNYLCRTVNSWRTSKTLPSMFTLLVTSGFMDATAAVAVGISPSMMPSAALLGPLMARSTWQTKPAIFTVTAILKVTVITFTRERCEWDSGLETAIKVTRMLTRTRAGRQCPGSSLKRCQKLSSKSLDLIHWTL